MVSICFSLLWRGLILVNPSIKMSITELGRGDAVVFLTDTPASFNRFRIAMASMYGSAGLRSPIA